MYCQYGDDYLCGSKDVFEIQIQIQSIDFFVVLNQILLYLLIITTEKTIQQKVAEKQRPFTLNVFKDFQFSWFIMKSERILNDNTQNQ